MNALGYLRLRAAFGLRNSHFSKLQIAGDQPKSPSPPTRKTMTTIDVDFDL